jgi:hypothetical protein
MDLPLPVEDKLVEVVLISSSCKKLAYIIPNHWLTSTKRQGHNN